MMPSSMMGSSNAQLQSTLAASTASNDRSILPHAPITCPGKLYFNEDNSFQCEHATAPPDDPRTQACINHSIALLLIELAFAL